MSRGDALNDLPAFGSEGEQDFSAILRGDLADHDGASDELFDDANGAVMPHLQLFGEVPNGERAAR